MTRRVTLTITDDDYQKAQHLAAQRGETVTQYLTLNAIGSIEAELEAEASENELAAMYLAAMPVAGNA